jgi:TolB-like protein/DNA-binding winged helix-turn-helix (wHTH) protein/Tfp pilus assembly protein PilF
MGCGTATAVLGFAFDHSAHMHDTPPNSGFRFGVFEFDVPTGELTKRGARVRLQGQPQQILLMLLERAGEVVSREELQQRLWSEDTFVEFDHSLNAAVKRLREALGDEASTPRFIETVPRRGYRFVAPVERVTGESRVEPEAPPAQEEDRAPARHAREASRWSRRGLVAAGVAAVVIAGLAGLVQWAVVSYRTVDAANVLPSRLAVIPFGNLTGDPGRDYVSEGLTEELIAQLGRLAPDRLAVIARSSMTWPSGARPPLPDLARALNVDHVVEGSVRNAGDRYRIAVRLVRTADLATVWSEIYEGALLDLLTVERGVSLEVARHMALTLAPEDPRILARATTASSDAYEAWLRGLYHLSRGPNDFAESIRLFQEAIGHDPTYALAHAGLSEAYLRQQDYGLVAPDGLTELAHRSALKALALDDRLAEAHCALGDVLSALRDMPAAEREFDQALALNPSHAASYDRYAWHLARVGRPRDARVLLQRARALAPRSADIATAAAYMDLATGQLDSAATLSRAALEFEPEFPFARYVLGQIAMRQGAPGRAIEEFARARRASDGAPKYVAALASAYLAANRTDEARQAVADLRAATRVRYVPPGTIEGLETRLRQREAP